MSDKILLLNYEFPPLGGGASPVSFELAENLVKTGKFEIDVVTMGFRNLPGYEQIYENFRIHRVRCWRSKKEMCYPWEQLTYILSANLKCRELLSKKKYDICYCHFLIPTGIVAYILKRRFRLPYIVTAHGSDVPGFNTDRFTFLHKFTGPILKKVCHNADCIISPSNYLKALILNNIDKTLISKIHHIPNGFKKTRFTPQKKERSILATGRLLPRKGFHFLIEAVASTDIGYSVHICGDGPMMSYLRTLQRKSKTNIILHGWMDNTSEEYKKLLESAAIYVLPSLKENASIALLEAMSAACAVITTNVSGCPETIGNAGILIEPENTSDLREKIYLLINNQKLLRQLQSAARNRIENIFDWNVVLDQYLALLGKVIEKNQVYK
jgi:glycosyltransferase involved in cell wall biosynthesis